MAISAFERSSIINHFETVQGTIVSSELRTRTKDDEQTYSVSISYRYEVDGHSYTSDRYQIDPYQTSSRKNATKLIKDYPTDREVAVYYDPNDPSRAALHLEAPEYFGFLFIQPFLLVGLVLIWLCISMPVESLWLKKFLTQPIAPPCRIPTWGVLRRKGNLLVIRQRPTWPRTLFFAAIPYGIVCFAGIFIVSSVFKSQQTAALWVFCIAGVAGVAGGLFWRRRHIRLNVRIDLLQRWTALQTPQSQMDLGFSSIESWVVNKFRVETSKKEKDDEDDLINCTILSLKSTDQDICLHDFTGCPQVLKVAEKVAQYFSEVTGHPVTENEIVVDSSEKPPDKTNQWATPTCTRWRTDH